MSKMVDIRVLDLAEFQATLRQYAALTRRSRANIANTKAFYIARRACRETYRPPPTAIGRSLSKIIYDFKQSAKGRVARTIVKTKVFNRFGGQEDGAPVAALLINWKKGKQGEKGLQGAAMRRAVNALIASRQRARAFLAAGWVPAIKALARLAERPSAAAATDREAMSIRRPKGSATPAREGVISAATIVSSAQAKATTTEDPLGKYGLVALQKAINAEAASMRDYIARKMGEDARRLGIKEIH